MSTTDIAVRTIEDTIRQVMNNSGAAGYYEQYARPVTAALIAREQQLSDHLLDYASDANLGVTEARQFLGEIGMNVPDVDVEEPDEEAEDDDEDVEDNRIAAALDRIERRLDGLTDFARRNGYRA